MIDACAEGKCKCTHAQPCGLVASGQSHEPIEGARTHASQRYPQGLSQNVARWVFCSLQRGAATRTLPPHTVLRPALVTAQAQAVASSVVASSASAVSSSFAPPSIADSAAGLPVAGGAEAMAQEEAAAEEEMEEAEVEAELVAVGAALPAAASQGSGASDSSTSRKRKATCKAAVAAAFAVGDVLVGTPRSRGDVSTIPPEEFEIGIVSHEAPLDDKPYKVAWASMDHQTVGRADPFAPRRSTDLHTKPKELEKKQIRKIGSIPGLYSGGGTVELGGVNLQELPVMRLSKRRVAFTQANLRTLAAACRAEYGGLQSKHGICARLASQ